MSTRKYLPRRNRTTAAAISFFLGAVGGQRFYLRQKGPAFFMMFMLIATSFKIAPIFFIFGIFEAVRFLSIRSSAMKANPFKNSGIKKYKDYDLEGAIEDFSQGLSINPKDIALHFNIACAYSMTEVKDKAYYHLSKAVELGFKDFEKIKTKDDLAFVRIQPEFDEFEESGYKYKICYYCNIKINF